MFQRNERGAFLLASKSVSLVEIAGVKENKPRTHGKVEQCPEIASAFRYL